MYTTIVVGTDGSDSAATAVRQAPELTKAGGGTLHIVHAYQPVNMGTLAMSAGSGGSTIDVEGVNASIESHARTVCEHASTVAQDKNVSCETHVVPGEPCDALVSRAGRTS